MANECPYYPEGCAHIPDSTDHLCTEHAGKHPLFIIPYLGWGVFYFKKSDCRKASEEAERKRRIAERLNRRGMLDELASLDT